MTMTLTPVLSRTWDQPESWTLPVYERNEGYQGLRAALQKSPGDVTQMVKDSELRGRGGAGFSTGMKWGFIPQGGDKPVYLVVNADESEPGTCKDIPVMMANPHELIEGAVIASYAIRAAHAFIYIRGEVVHVLRRVQNAVAEAYEAGYAGKDILGSGYDLEITVHAGAGAYICGEETALLDSLEGRRGQPRLRPPFPAIAGLYSSPTVINNVESIASVPSILRNGADWFAAMGTEAKDDIPEKDKPRFRSKGMTLFSLSGHVNRPGQYEAPMGITLRELLDLSGGVRTGHHLKFWTPGGSSTPILTEQHLDVPLSYEGIASAKSMLGTKALQIFDETTCVVRAVLRWTEFYAHESCGKCTPCREGTFWLVQILRRLENGGRLKRDVPDEAQRREMLEDDLQRLDDICDTILGRSFCALGDGAVSPITSSLQYFRDEYVDHFEHEGCPFDPAAATLFQPAAAQGAGGRTR
jgi:NADH-quinone oxidoreductase subunit F